MKAGVALLLWLVATEAMAASNNSFSGSLFLGDSYAPTNFRLSISNFDIGASDTNDLYAGSRAWLGSYYAGFGLSIKPGVYGFVGYEWRFISWLGLCAEFDGMMSTKGEAAGRVYLGIVAGW